MFPIQQITKDPLQNFSLTLPDSSSIALQICFRPQQLGWFINSLTYGVFVLNCMRITTNPNMLHQYRNLIPFGMACFTQASREPMFIEDFSEGNATLYILSEDEVKQYVSFLNGS